MTELLSILPNLSIGVVCIGALVYVTVQFLNKLEASSKSHESAMQEREEALRRVEREIRGELIGVVQRSNQAIAENSKVMERVVDHMNKH